MEDFWTEGGTLKPHVPYEEIQLDLPIGPHHSTPLRTPAPA
jgi:hypothetical protein